MIEKNKILESWIMVEPVSYTHLDVYKRQILRGRLGSEIDDRRINRMNEEKKKYL